MKISALFIIFLLCSTLNAQEDNIWETMNMKKVQINKNLTAYTIYTSNVKNGIESKGKMNNPSLKNPYNITIRSNDNSGKIVINNKKNTEDIVLNFKYIYKIPDKDFIVYEFLMVDERITARFFDSTNGTNDTLFVSYESDSNNSISVQYTIAKN